jgi:GxxExxY protein
MDINELTSRIINAAIVVHRSLGPGLLESVYQKCLLVELEHTGIHAVGEVAVSVIYRNKIIAPDGFRIDLLVEDMVVVELKSVEEVRPVHKKQLLTYLRLADKPMGLLINFNEVLLKNGITRVINTVNHSPHGDAG